MPIGSSSSPLVRPLRFDFPRFHGSNVVDWILKANDFLDYYGVDDAQRLDMASFHMDGVALEWYRSLVQKQPISTWAEFTLLMEIRFAENNLGIHSGSLEQLKQHGVLDMKLQAVDEALEKQSDLLHSLQATVAAHQQSMKKIALQFTTLNNKFQHAVRLGGTSSPMSQGPTETQDFAIVGGGGAPLTRSLGFGFPRFDGSVTLGWICKAEEIFDYYGIADSQRLAISSVHLDGAALLWFQCLDRNKQLTSWNEFTRALKVAFHVFDEMLDNNSIFSIAEVLTDAVPQEIPNEVEQFSGELKYQANGMVGFERPQFSPFVIHMLPEKLYIVQLHDVSVTPTHPDSIIKYQSDSSFFTNCIINLIADSLLHWSILKLLSALKKNELQSDYKLGSVSGIVWDPGVKGSQVQLNENETIIIHKGTYIETILDGSFLNIVPHIDGYNRAFSFNQVGKIWSATSALLEHCGRSIRDLTVVFHGFESAGFGEARLIHEVSIKVIAVSDINGAIRKAKGIDIKALRGHKETIDSLANFSNGDVLDATDLLLHECVVLIPYALGGLLNKENARNDTAKIVTVSNIDEMLSTIWVIRLSEIYVNVGCATIIYCGWI